jgi:hypothetical protein
MISTALHEWVELAKGLAWPSVVLYCVIRYAREVKIILRTVGSSIERVKSAKGFGVELEVKEFELDVKLAEPELGRARVLNPEKNRGE